MVHFDPAAIEAAGTVILAAETGVAMAIGKKSTEKTGQLTCDPSAKVGSAMRCGEKIETKYECTEVVEKKK